MKTIYVDFLTWRIFFKVLKSDSKYINVLEKNNFFDSLIKNTLKLFGKHVYFLDFFAGSLIDKDYDEVVYLKSFKMANDFSVDLSSNIINSSSALKKINSLYGNNTLQLHIAKYLQGKLFKLFLKINSFEVLSKSTYKSELIIKSPSFFLDEIKKLFHNSNIIFYGNKLSPLIETLKLLLKELSYRIFQKLSFKRTFNKVPNSLKHNKGFLTIQEESIRKDQSLRGHLHWIDFNERQIHPFYTLSLNYIPNKIVDDIKVLNTKNIYIYSRAIINYAKNKKKDDIKLKMFKQDLKNLWKSLLVTKYHQFLFTIKSIFLMYRSLDIASVCLYLNTKVYIAKEPYFIYSDAIQLIAKEIKVKVLGYQYSNLGYHSIQMIPSFDIFLTFSNAYKKIFSKKNLGPREIKNMGYLLEGIEPRLKQRVEILKNKLKLKGVNFIIAYFDESIQNNKWGLLNKESYERHVVELAKKILNDKTLAVLFKSQFNLNSIEKLFKENKIISDAMESGRLINVFEGDYRNDVYPIQVALASDICINDIIGASAALEVVSVGKRCILLNEHNYKTLHDPVYYSSNIIFKDFSDALNEIDMHREKIEKGFTSNLGDWDDIKDYFLSNEKIRGINKIKSEALKLMES